MDSNYYRLELNNLIANKARPAQITVARGRLIRALNSEIKASTDPATISQLQAELQSEMSRHQVQLNDRLGSAKRSNDSVVTQLVNEVEIKNRKIANSARQFANSQTKGEYLANGAKVVGNTLSTVGTIAKAPIMATLRLASLAVPVVTSIAVQPLQIPAYFFSKIINPYSNYNGQVITNLGREVGNLIARTLDLSNDAIRRI